MSEKLDMQSPDMVANNIDKIAALFPHCVTETAEGKAVDFDLLKQEFNTKIVEGTKERYRLEWPGKREAIVTANLPTTKTLRPIREDSVDFDTTQNLYIEGDNLEVLKLLQESYLNKIKMIYIDPPYNTGKDFVYKDNFKKDATESNLESGLIDDEGNKLVGLKLNPETNATYHSDWLSMMYPRLKLARNLMTEDGVIFISIDDNEVHNLRKLCDEVFGGMNFVANVIWQKKYSPQNDAKWFSNMHDHILCYSKNKDIWRPNLYDRTEEQNARYSNPDNDPRGDWKSSDFSVKTYSANYDYPVTTPSGRIVNPPTSRCWRTSKENFEKLVNDNRIWFGANGENVPSVKKFLTEVKQGITPSTIWFRSDVGDNQEAAKEIRDIFEIPPFDTPKPVRLLSRMIELGINKNDIVLDFFSGSATTGDAVMQLNAEDGGYRKFIMVQVPETTDEKSEAYKAGYTNICEIGKERIRRAGKKIKENLNQDSQDLKIKQDAAAKKNKEKGLANIFESKDTTLHNQKSPVDSVNPDSDKKENSTDDKLDIGFRVYRLADSNMKDVYYRPQDFLQENLDLFEDNIQPDRTADDLLIQVMLDWGLQLSLPIEQISIENKKVFKVAGNSLYACFDAGIDEAFAKELATHKPLRVVFKGRSFKDDSAKENVKQLLKQLSAGTQMKVI